MDANHITFRRGDTTDVIREIQSLITSCSFPDTTLFCGDGHLQLSRVVVGVLWPQFASLFTTPGVEIIASEWKTQDVKNIIQQKFPELESVDAGHDVITPEHKEEFKEDNIESD